MCRHKILFPITKSLFIFALLLSSTLDCFSQDKDAAFWPGIKLSHPFNDKLKETVFIQERIENNISKHDNIFFDFCTSYQIFKNLDAEAAYVYVNHVNSDNSHSNQHQFYFDFVWKQKISKRFKFKYTPQFQMQWTDINTSPNGKISENFLRNKFALEYRLKKRIQPFVFIEFRSNVTRQPFYFNRTRYSAGTTFHLHKKIDIDVYYMLQRGYNEGSPDDLYIIVINFCKEI